MKTFTIDSDNNITVYPSAKAAKEAGTGVLFTGEDNLAELLGADSKRLVAIWNSIPGNVPVRKFTSNAVAQKRIMAAISKLGTELPPDDPAPRMKGYILPEDEPGEPTEAEIAESHQATTMPEERAAEPAQNAEPAPAKKGRKAKAAKAARAPKAAKSSDGSRTLPREGSKLAQVLKMLQRKNGATLDEIMSAMDWQIHTTRALMSAGGAYAKKFGITVISETVGDKRTYRVAK